ncbi:MAG: hypothetical protein ACYS1A_08245 [Planctomycetota bacterium]|jgi:hypothetical protein
MVKETKAQKIIKRHQKQAKRTQKETWADMELLSTIVRSGSGNVDYKEAMKTLICLRSLKRKTQTNATIWKAEDEKLQLFLRIARGAK